MCEKALQYTVGFSFMTKFQSGKVTKFQSHIVTKFFRIGENLEL
jgi:hypothetical protein